jgi:D-xylose transport system permease protein
MSDTTTTTPPPAEPEPAGGDPTTAAQEQAPLSPRAALRALSQGELGSVRVLLAIALVWAIFQFNNSNFLSAFNLTNLVLQVVAVGLISVGVVLILLLGEIDLSIGSVSGLCAAIMVVLNVQHGWSAPLAILAAIAGGMVVGLFQGFFVNFFQIPSFVVTLAGLIGWQGLQLQVLGKEGTINTPQTGLIPDLTGKFFSDAIGWILAIVVVAVFIGNELWERRSRASKGLENENTAVFALRAGAVVAAVIASVWVLNSDRGVPLAALIFIAFVTVFAFVTKRTRFGRHVYAVGGGAEAARRAGISVVKIRMTVFVISSTMAAIGGVMAASRLLAVNQSSGGGDVLLFAIAGPVVAGVSLFGGRGTVWAALLGALLIGSISNGMDLLGLSSPVKFMITGGVLLAAVTLDSITRLRRQTVRR